MPLPGVFKQIEQPKGGRTGPHAMAEERFSAKRGMALLLLAAMLVTVFAGLIGGASKAWADDDDDVGKYSFYKLSAVLTGSFSDYASPESEKPLPENWRAELATPANGGSVLGYVDPKFSVTDLSWLKTRLTGTSDAMSYDMLTKANGGDRGQGNHGEGGLGSHVFQGTVDYAHFGAALSGLGLDSTSTGMSSAATGIFSFAGGLIVMILYTAANLVEMLMGGILEFLKLTNPFKLFYDAFASINPSLAAGMVGGDTSVWGPLQGMASFVGSIYSVINTMSWGVLVPISMGVLVIGLLISKRMDRGSAVKRLVVRLAFLGLGLPLLGSLYTGALDSMADGGLRGNTGATKMVLSTYVDFEAWAKNQRLAVPDGAVVEWDVAKNKPSGDAVAGIRTTALAINASSYSPWGNLKPLTTSANQLDWSGKAMEEDEGSRSDALASFTGTVDMLDRYMKGSHYEASAMESEMKGDISSMIAEDAGMKEPARGWFDTKSGGFLGTGWGGDSGADNSSYDVAGNPILVVAPGSGLTALGGAPKKFTSPGVGASCSSLSKDGAPGACNLSPLAMYNYLNTSFGPTSMTVYSSDRAMSTATREMHSSVSAVGQGPMPLMYWANTVVVLGAIVTIGLGYAFGMMFSSIRRGIQLVTAIPFATLGFMGGIAKVIVYTVALLGEVLGTIFIYKLVMELLLALPAIIEVPFALMSSSGFLGQLIATGPMLSFVTTLLGIIMVIVFTAMAMRVRKTVLKAIEDGSTKIVNKFLDTQTSAGGGGGGMLPALAGGAAAGMGAAAATRMMSNGGSKGADGSGAGGDGPGSIGVGSDTAAEAGDVSEQTAIESSSGDQAQIEGGDSSTASDVSSGTVMEASDGAGALPAGAVGRDADGNPVDASGNVVSDTGSAGQGAVDADSRDRQLAAQAMENGLPQGASPQGAGGAVDSDGSAGGPERQVTADGGSGPGQHDAPKAQDPAAAAAMLAGKGKGLPGGPGEQPGGASGGATQNGLPKGPGQRSQPGAKPKASKGAAATGQGQQGRGPRPGAPVQQQGRHGQQQPQPAKQAEGAAVRQQGQKQQSAQPQARPQQGIRKPPISPQTAGYIGLGMAQGGMSAAKAKREAKEKEVGDLLS